MTHSPALQLSHISKSFDPNLPPVVKEISLEIKQGELLTLLGPSGCGKTTALRLIAGLEKPDSGSIAIAGQDVGKLPAEKRGVGLVFQDYALFPHLSVLKNVMFGLQHLPKTDRLQRAQEMLTLTGLTAFAQRAPHQLSGGQQQRVALARALAPSPALMLLDEPFSNLDAQLRHATRREVRQILQDSGTAAILVTHDQEEALAFSDRIAIMQAGQLEQVGSPPEVYQQPTSAFVASFLGRSNLVSGNASGLVAQTYLGPVQLQQPANGPVVLSIRPEQLAFATADSPSTDNMGISANIVSCEYGGAYTHYRLQLVEQSEQEVLMFSCQQQDKQQGQQVQIQVMGAVRALR